MNIFMGKGSVDGETVTGLNWAFAITLDSVVAGGHKVFSAMAAEGASFPISNDIAVSSTVAVSPKIVFFALPPD